MKSFLSRFRNKIPYKNRGDVLVITLILSAFMLLVGLALSRFLLQDLYFVRNLIWSETAYFAAESGVEEALIRLKNNPIENINENVPVRGSIKSVLTVENLKTEHTFTLAQNETKRFRLERDGKPALDNWELQATGVGKISWRIICQKNKLSDGSFLGNVAIQSHFNSPTIIASFKDQSGNFDDISDPSGADIPTQIKPITHFLGIINTQEERNSCFVNYQNLSSNDISVTLKNPQGITPEKAVIKSVGQAGQKEKVIYYQFTQSGLSSFFDFGVLLTE